MRGGLAGRTVLVLDNEEAILSGMKVILSGWGCHAICVADRAAAIAAAGRGGIDAIVADYHLDAGDTGDAVVRALGLGIPTIIVTAIALPS